SPRRPSREGGALEEGVRRAADDRDADARVARLGVRVAEAAGHSGTRRRHVRARGRSAGSNPVRLRPILGDGLVPRPRAGSSRTRIVSALVEANASCRAGWTAMSGHTGQDDEPDARTEVLARMRTALADAPPRTGHSPLAVGPSSPLPALTGEALVDRF